MKHITQQTLFLYLVCLSFPSLVFSYSTFRDYQTFTSHLKPYYVEQFDSLSWLYTPTYTSEGNGFTTFVGVSDYFASWSLVFLWDFCWLEAYFPTVFSSDITIEFASGDPDALGAYFGCLDIDYNLTPCSIIVTVNGDTNFTLSTNPFPVFWAIYVSPLTSVLIQKQGNPNTEEYLTITNLVIGNHTNEVRTAASSPCNVGGSSSSSTTSTTTTSHASTTTTAHATTASSTSLHGSTTTSASRPTTTSHATSTTTGSKGPTTTSHATTTTTAHATTASSTSSHGSTTTSASAPTTTSHASSTTTGSKGPTTTSHATTTSTAHATTASSTSPHSSTTTSGSTSTSANTPITTSHASSTTTGFTASTTTSSSSSLSDSPSTTSGSTTTSSLTSSSPQNETTTTSTATGSTGFLDGSSTTGSVSTTGSITSPPLPDPKFPSTCNNRTTPIVQKDDRFSGPVTLTLSDFNCDAQNWTVFNVSNNNPEASELSLDFDTQLFSLVISPNFTGTYGYLIYLNDSSTFAHIQVTIDVVNHNPVIANETFLYNPSSTEPFPVFNLLQNASDPDGDTFSVVELNRTRGWPKDDLIAIDLLTLYFINATAVVSVSNDGDIFITTVDLSNPASPQPGAPLPQGWKKNISFQYKVSDGDISHGDSWAIATINHD